MIEPGFYKLSNAEYHTGPGISKSGLARILRSPLHYKTPQKETAALVTGDAFHVATLEPNRFDREYTVLPASCSPGSGKGMKERKEQFLADNAQKTILSQLDYDTARGMAATVHSNQDAIDLLSDGEAEISGYWYDPENPAILCKLRMDWINKKDRIIVDLKSCTDARFFKFRSDAFNNNNNYHMQAAWYLYGLTQITKVEHHDFYFIAIEKEPPYGVKIYKADKEMIQLGLMECQRALDIYADCLAKDEWPCYGDGIEILTPPEYLKQKIFD